MATTQNPVEAPLLTRPPATQPTSIRYALIVPVLAVVMLGVFAIVNQLGSSPASVPSVPLSSFGPTTGLGAAFYATTQATPPPADIVRAIVVPSGSAFLGHQLTGEEPSSFDVAGRYRSTESQGWLFGFFKAQLRHLGWTLQSSGTSAKVRNGLEVIATKNGSDTFGWNLGIVLSPTSFTQDVASGVPAQSTVFSVQLYQNIDQS